MLVLALDLLGIDEAVMPLLVPCGEFRLAEHGHGGKELAPRPSQPIALALVVSVVYDAVRAPGLEVRPCSKLPYSEAVDR